MNNLNLLRDIITSGWTREARKQFEPCFKNFSKKELAEIFQKVKKIGFTPTPELDFEGECVVSFIKTPETIEQYYKTLMKNIDSIRTEMEGYDAWEIAQKSAREFCEQNTRDTFGMSVRDIEHIEDITPFLLEKKKNMFEPQDLDLFKNFVSRKKLGLKVKAFKFSDVIRTNKNTGASEFLKADKAFSSVQLTSKDRESFVEEMARAFNLTGSKKNGIMKEFDTILNYAIKKDNKIIGYYSLKAEKGVLSIHNYTILPEYRNGRTSLNAILQLRDNVTKIAKEKGYEYVNVMVDGNNPELLGLYRRFGFKEAGVVTMDYINDHKIPAQFKYYSLFQKVA